MEKQYFIGLLRKFLNNEATKDEEEFLARYYDLYEDKPDLLKLFSEQEKDEFKNQLQRDIWQNIHKNEQAVAKIRKMPARTFRLVAAAAAVLVFVSTIIVYLNKSSSEKQPVVTLNNPLQENHIIRLADGSTVVLGVHSKMHYPPSFDDLPTREVYLEGEAFFDISKDSLKPFIVHTGKVRTSVLGTAFNIKAFPHQNDITVTVKRGKVRVDADEKTLGIIIPQQQIVYNKNEGRSVSKTVDPDVYLTLNHNDLFFDDLTFQEAARLLEDRFNVKIVITDEVMRAKKFTTTIPYGQNLHATLQGLCEFNAAVYEYNEQTSTVIIKAKN